MVFPPKVTGDERRQMIAEAAYFRAERRGFEGGDAVRDWCEAEVEIDTRLQRLDGDQLVAKLEETFEAAGKRLAAVRRKIGKLSAAARVEWQKDAERLSALREATRPKLAELKLQGERASVKLREQGERMRTETAELLRLLEAKIKDR